MPVGRSLLEGCFGPIMGSFFLSFPFSLFSIMAASMGLFSVWFATLSPFFSLPVV